MAEFGVSYLRTLGHEGGYSNLYADRGGETWRGIARVIWPMWDGWVMVDQEKAQGGEFEKRLACRGDLDAKVRAFYQSNFWSQHSLMLLPQSIADKVFDIGVNCGLSVAGKVVQNMLNFGNRDQRDYPDLVVDGHMGPVTAKALNKLVELRGERLVGGALVCEHYRTYREIVVKDPSQELHWWGWLKRNLSYL